MSVDDARTVCAILANRLRTHEEFLVWQEARDILERELVRILAEQRPK